MVYQLITFSIEGVIVFIGDTLFEWTLNILFDISDTLSLALFASILFVHLHALTLAIRTRTSLLGIHSGTEHDKFLYHLLALAC